MCHRVNPIAPTVPPDGSVVNNAIRACSTKSERGERYRVNIIMLFVRVPPKADAVGGIGLTRCIQCSVRCQ